MEEVTFPVRVMQQLGINYLFVSNATGGLNPDYVVGDIMVINDHINFFPEHPLRGPNIAELGPRFPDMSRVYDERLRYAARLISLENNFNLKEGVYVGVSGPTFETPAEYLMFRRLGGDVVGMSTVPEVIVARHAGMRVFGISIITDSGVPGQIVEISHEEVQKVAMKAEPKMTLVLKKLIESIVVRTQTVMNNVVNWQRGPIMTNFILGIDSHKKAVVNNNYIGLYYWQTGC
jgi:purine-nucleoside phosphorylase